MIRFLLSILTLLVVLGSNCQSVFSAPSMSYGSLLRKLSIHLRGHPPSIEEYELLRGIESEAEFSIVWKKLIEDFQRSSQYQAKMVDRLYDLFRLAKPTVLQEWLIQEEDWLGRMTPKERSETLSGVLAGNEYLFLARDSFVRNSLDYLFRSLTRENRSWLSLLNSTDYEIPVDGRGGTPNDFMFYSKVKSCELDSRFPPILKELLVDRYTLTNERIDISSAGSNTLGELFGLRGPLSCDVEDPRVGGVITTARFLRRYSRSAVNKNFKRAAAVFRIFLCDDMRPIVLEGSVQGEILRQKNRFSVLRQLKNSDLEHLSSTNELPKFENKGRDSAGSCISCHYKLDPMAKVFTNTSYHLTETPIPGEIVFTDTNQMVRRIPVRGIGDLGKELAEIREVRKCQVKHFWDWFIGKDVILTAQRTEEILQKLEAVDFKTNQVVSIIVSLPEFFGINHEKNIASPLTRSEMISRFQNVWPFFQRCTSCHMGNGKDIEGPNLEIIPFSVNKESHQQLIKRVSIVLDLANQGEGATMPPDRRWPDHEQLMDSVRLWICAGAPDAKGEPTVDLNTLKPSFCGGGVR